MGFQYDVSCSCENLYPIPNCDTVSKGRGERRRKNPVENRMKELE
jgi:hypothetical protein